MDALETLKKYLTFPSVSTDSRYKEGMYGAAGFMSGVLQSLGFATELVPTPLHPVLYARREGPKEWPHVVLYGHYDVQPAEPLDLWDTMPFEPVVKGERIYARGSADNKGPFTALITGLSRVLESRPDYPVRITVILEGEEEIGSPNLAPFLQEKKEELQGADFVLLADTCSQSRDQIMITTGLRGIACLEFTLTGPSTDLHSGMFGGPVVNPALAIAELLSKVHDKQGRVAIPGFYDAVKDASTWEQDQVCQLGITKEKLAESLGVPALRSEEGYSVLDQIRMRPTFEVNGIYGGYSGEGSKTIIPSKVTAKISCRLVPDQDPSQILDLVGSWLESQVPAGVTIKVTKGHSGSPYGVLPPQAPGSSVAADSPLGRAFLACEQAIEQATGNPPLYLREGGSIPVIASIRRILGLDSLMIGLFTPEDRLHAPNESMDLVLFERGIQVSESIWASLAG
jgi:acetylornithine deacetylase/succinyl-diaminopimelate desuccinylase-like protein